MARAAQPARRRSPSNDRARRARCITRAGAARAALRLGRLLGRHPGGDRPVRPAVGAGHAAGAAPAPLDRPGAARGPAARPGPAGGGGAALVALGHHPRADTPVPRLAARRAGGARLQRAPVGPLRRPVGGRAAPDPGGAQHARALRLVAPAAVAVAGAAHRAHHRRVARGTRRAGGARPPGRALHRGAQRDRPDPLAGRAALGRTRGRARHAGALCRAEGSLHPDPRRRPAGGAGAAPGGVPGR